MRLGAAVGPVVLVAGLVTLGLAVSRGEASLFLVVIVPVLTGTGPLTLLGILLVFVGFFLTFLSWPMRAAFPQEEVPTAGPSPTAPPTTPPTRRARRWGGVLFLGPLPLVFGSDPRMTWLMILVGAILFFGLLALTLLALLR